MEAPSPATEGLKGNQGEDWNLVRMKGKEGKGPRVGIIGAGVSGLAACKHFSQRGLNVTVLEAKSGIGGIWRHTYASTALQTSRRLFEYSDFPWPESASEFPMHQDVMEYLEGYTQRFGLLDKIQFNCQVVHIRRGNSVATDFSWDALKDRNLTSDEDLALKDAKSALWEVRVRKKILDSTDSSHFSEESYEFDFLVLCCGCFGDLPSVPSYPEKEGPEVFLGQVLHSLEYSSLDPKKLSELVDGKKVVVVGFGKTALDIVTEVANAQKAASGGTCIMLFRRTHWMFPHQMPMAFGYIPFMYLCYTRFGELFAPKPNQGILQRILQFLFRPLRWIMWKTVEYSIRNLVPLSKLGILPDHSLIEDISGCMIPSLPVGFVPHLENGRIIPVKTLSFSFCPQGLLLGDGKKVEADTVLLCTGYNAQEKLKAILPITARESVFEKEDTLSLYRGLVHPKIPGLGILGYREGLSTTHSAELGAVWLAHLIRGQFSLPDHATMQKDMSKWWQYRKTVTPLYNRPCIGSVEIWHYDTLCKDMGVSRNAQKLSWWNSLFSIPSIKNYKLTD
ncbi:unnamed protein product [Calypogeia fissa]